MPLRWLKDVPTLFGKSTYIIVIRIHFDIRLDDTSIQNGGYNLRHSCNQSKHDGRIFTGCHR